MTIDYDGLGGLINVDQSMAMTRILEHGVAIASVLNSEWVSEGRTRAFHARYWRFGLLQQAVIVQQRGVEGFQVGMIRHGFVDQIHTGIAMSLAGVCVWLGLDDVPSGLDWRVEL